MSKQEMCLKARGKQVLEVGEVRLMPKQDNSFPKETNERGRMVVMQVMEELGNASEAADKAQVLKFRHHRCKCSKEKSFIALACNQSFNYSLCFRLYLLSGLFFDIIKFISFYHMC